MAAVGILAVAAGIPLRAAVAPLHAAAVEAVVTATVAVAGTVRVAAIVEAVVATVAAEATDGVNKLPLSSPTNRGGGKHPTQLAAAPAFLSGRKTASGTTRWDVY
jgi:hypothetical protein